MATATSNALLLPPDREMPKEGYGEPAGLDWFWCATSVPLFVAALFPARPSARDKEKELLAVFTERQEITAVTAAMRTSLTADEAAKMLDDLAGKGHLRLWVDDGVQAYSLPEADRLEMPERHTDTALVVPESESDGHHRPPKEDLSERELEVLALLATGRTNSEVADALFVAQGTVKAHVANIYRKLDANNRAEALSRARELKLLP